MRIALLFSVRLVDGEWWLLVSARSPVLNPQPNADQGLREWAVNHSRVRRLLTGLADGRGCRFPPGGGAPPSEPAAHPEQTGPGTHKANEVEVIPL